MDADRWPLETQWHLKMDSKDAGLREGWQTQPLDDEWQAVNVPGHWEDLRGEAYQGIAWYSACFDAPEPSPDKRRGLCLVGIDDIATVFLNGRQLSPALAYLQPMAFDLEDLLREGKNQLHVRVVEHGGEGGNLRQVFLGRFIHDASELCRSAASQQPARESVDWVQEAVIYEVFLRSFSEAGNLQALTDRLEELDRLGVTVLWLMPIHPVGELNRKGSLGSPYSVQDYRGIDPAYGDVDDMRALVRAAHKLEMRVIIDWVANHSAWDHAWIGERPEFYARNEQGEIQPPNKDWSDVADLNYDSAELRSEMSAALRYWIEEVGIDGFRCDVADMVPRDFWESVRDELESIRPIMMLAEGDHAENHLKAFDLTYDWGIYNVLGDLKDGKLSPRRIKRHFDEITSMYPQGSLLMRFSTNHDLNAWEIPAIKRYGPEAARAAATLVFCLPGVPMIYNGQEVANDKPLELFEATKIDWKRDDHGLRDLYSDLSMLRHEFPVLSDPHFEIIDAEAGDQILRLVRGRGDSAVLLLMNLSLEATTVDLSGRLVAFHEELLRSLSVRRMSDRIKLPPLGYWVATAEMLE